MRTTVEWTFVGVIVAWSGSCAPAYPPPPDTDRKEVVDTIHGFEIADPYRWLEDGTSQKTRSWIDAQNAYDFGPDLADVTAEYLAANAPYQPYTDGRITMR